MPDHRRRCAWIRAVLCLCLILLMEACRQGPHEEITRTTPYSGMIGTEYEVTADDLYAYGIYESLPGKSVSWITLVPGVGIDGPEVAFRRHIFRGQPIKIISAWRAPILLEDAIYYRVAMPGADVPDDVPIRLELARGNEAGGPDLNPKIYRKLRGT
jgi:hypothetical protein